MPSFGECWSLVRGARIVTARIDLLGEIYVKAAGVLRALY